MENQDKIKAYVEGTLSTAEKQQFEDELRTNEDLQLDVNFYHLEQDMINVEIEDDIRVKAKQWQLEASETPVSSTSIIKRLRRPLSVAASLLAVVSTIGLFFANSNYSDQSIATKAYKTPELSSISRDVDSGTTIFEKGSNTYDAAQYQVALEIFQEIPQSSPSYYQAQFNIAHCYNQLDQTTEAIQSFQLVIDGTKDKQLKQFAEWYLALTYLDSEGESSNFKAQLSKILANPNHRKLQDAQDLKASLDSFWRWVVWN